MKTRRKARRGKHNKKGREERRNQNQWKKAFPDQITSDLQHESSFLRFQSEEKTE